jgi:hypothetical protein
MKYLYVLVSDASDYYLEQALLSITSLRLQMPNAFISLLTDDITELNLIGRREGILKLINELKSITIDEKFNKKARSRWLKTSMRMHITGDFLYIDNDTIIADDLSSIDNIDADIAAVLNDHIYLSEFVKARLHRMNAYYKKLGFINFSSWKYFFNGGVILCRDNKTGHEFFREWHRLWLLNFELGNVTDQQSLNQVNFSMNNVIREIDGIWNCQILNDGALRFLHYAKIIHYFSTQPAEKAFLLANKEYIKSIKETGVIDDKTKELLKNPKSLFAFNTRIMLIDKSSREFYNSAIFAASKKLFYTKFGTVIEFVFFNIRKYIFSPLRKIFSKTKNR